MKRAIIGLFLVLLATSAWADFNCGTTGNTGGAAAPPAGDTCGTDNCTLIWYAEHATDVTSGTPAGCSSGDTSPALTGATISDAQYSDGSHSLLVDAVQRYAEFSSADIIGLTAGTVEFKVRVHTFLAGASIFSFPYGGDSSLRIYMTGAADNIEFEAKVYYPYSSITVTTDGVDGVVDTWYKVRVRYRQTDNDPNLDIYVYNASDTELDNAASNTNYNAWTGTGTTFTLGCLSWLEGSLVENIDGVKIWDAWKE